MASTLHATSEVKLTTIDLAHLEDVIGGYDFKRTGRKMLGGAVSGASAGGVGGFLTGGPAGAATGAAVGGVTGGLGAGIYDAGSQLHLW